MNWFKLSLVASSVGCGILSVLLPPAAVYTVPAATFLFGWAIKSPGDAPKSEVK